MEVAEQAQAQAPLVAQVDIKAPCRLQAEVLIGGPLRQHLLREPQHAALGFQIRLDPLAVAPHHAKADGGDAHAGHDVVVRARRRSPYILRERRVQHHHGKKLRHIVHARAQKASPGVAIVLHACGKELFVISRRKDFVVAVKGENKQIVLENSKIKVVLQSKGGNVASVELKEYTRPDKKTKVELFTADSSSQSLIFLAYNNTLQVHTDSLYFIPSDVKKTADEQIISLRLPTANPKSYIEYIYTLKNDGYMLNYQVKMVEMQNIISQNTDQLTFNWNVLTPSQEEHIEKEYYFLVFLIVPNLF